MIRILVVDDSAFARKVLRETLSRHAGFEVVGIARDGLEALERIAELKPDVITLDLVMPNLDGVGLLKLLPKTGGPRVVVVSMANEDSELGLAALANGAIDVVRKPTSLATERLYELADELIAKVAAAATATQPVAQPQAAIAPLPFVAGELTKKILLIGASTGGPQALTTLLQALPATFPVPIAIVLHMPVGYTETFAKRLDDDCAIDVCEATDRMTLRAGQAVVGRAGIHFKLERQRDIFRVSLDVLPIGTPHCPAVDVLFSSAVATNAADVLALVLTGMGDDGCKGARTLHAAGATILTQSAASCVVYGMPRAIDEAGLSSGNANVHNLPGLIAQHLSALR